MIILSTILGVIYVVHDHTSQNTMYCGGEPEHKRVAN